VSDEAYALSLAPAARRVLAGGPPRGLPVAVATEDGREQLRALGFSI
jgi:hypothetical protein